MRSSAHQAVHHVYSQGRDVIDHRGEYRLLVGTLVQTYLDLRGKGPCTTRSPRVKREIVRNARYWLASKDTCPWSFRWVCEMLSIRPRILRQRLLDPETKLTGVGQLGRHAQGRAYGKRQGAGR